MLARAALGAIIKAAAKSAAKKVATKEVGKVAEINTRKLGSSAAAKAAPKKPTQTKSSGPRSEASRTNQYNERQVRKYDDQDGGGLSKAEKTQSERTQKAESSAKARKTQSKTTSTPAKATASKATPKKSLSSSAAKEATTGEAKAGRKYAASERQEAKNHPSLENTKGKPATSAGRKLGDKVTSKPDTRLSKTSKPRNMKEMKERHEASGGTKRPLSAGQKDRHSNYNVANRDKFGTGRAKARKNINA